MYKVPFRNHLIELDFLRKQPPKWLYGGRIDKVGYENQEALVTIPVHSLAEIEPFRLYNLIIRRHFPENVKGLPLKFKILGNIALESKNYIGAGVKDECHREFEEHGQCDFEGTHGDCVETEVIVEKVPAEVFDAVMYGFGNAAMLDDIICFDNSPFPYIIF